MSQNQKLGNMIPYGQQTIWVPSYAMIPRTTNGAESNTVETATNLVMLKTLNFDASTAEHAQFTIRIPKSWNEANVFTSFVWSHLPTTTNFSVVWAAQAFAVGNAEDSNTAFGTVANTVDTGGVNNAIYISDKTELSIGNSPAAEDLITFQVLRQSANTSDDLAVDARLHGITIYYTVDTNKDN